MASQSHRRHIRVAIAEDHPVMRGGLRALLLANGLDVVAEADNGTDIIELVAQLRPDVVLMDLEMPGMGGVAATIALVERDPDARVLVLTMHADDDSVFSALRAGARGYLVKGSDPHHIVGAVRAVAEGQVIFDAALAQRVLSELQLPRVQQAFPALTSREREVFALLADGLNNRVIAQRLGVSSKTVANHVSNVFAKLHLADRVRRSSVPVTPDSATPERLCPAQGAVHSYPGIRPGHD